MIGAPSPFSSRPASFRFLPPADSVFECPRSFSKRGYSIDEVREGRPKWGSNSTCRECQDAARTKSGSNNPSLAAICQAARRSFLHRSSQ